MKHLFLISFFTLVYCSSMAQDVFEACRKGDISRIETLMKLKPDTISSVNAAGFTPLIIAGYRNQLDVVEFLLKQGVNANADSPEGPAIIAAGYKGNIKLAQLLINHKANLDVTNADGTTALMYAVMGNHSDLVKLLIRAGADKLKKSQSGKNALDYARLYNYPESIALLSE